MSDVIQTHNIGQINASYYIFFYEYLFLSILFTIILLLLLFTMVEQIKKYR